MQKSVEYVIKFTEAYKNAPDIFERELNCLELMFDYVFLPLQDGDLFAGRLLYPPLGLAPEPLGGRGVCFNYEERAFERLIEENPKEAQELKAIKDFWETENTRRKIREAFPKDISEALPFDDVYYKEYGAAFPLYRVVGIYINYDELLTLGLSGLREKISFKKANTNDKKSARLYESMLKALEIFKNILKRYSEQTKKTLPDLSEALENISERKPETFYEAAQLAFLYTLVCGSYNYGRMDVYLGDFYKRDLDKGVINQEQALEYLKSIWRLIAARESVFHGRVIIGGLGRRNEENADALALLCIEATRLVEEIEPQLSLRFYSGQNPELMKAAIRSIAQGRTYPMLYNDDVNVPAVADAFEININEAQEYLPFGCGEYVINHKSFGSPNGIINMLKVLEITMRGGYDAQTGKRMGLLNKKFEKFESFEEFFDAYKKQLAYYIKILARQQKIEYEVVSKQANFLFMSMLYDDCIERGRSIFDGGIKYLGGTLETYGNVNSADSLTALKKLVFDTKQISKSDYIKALDADFVGYELIQKMAREAPKYGNDDAYADEIALALHNFVCEKTRKQKDKVGLHSYLVVIINNEANTLLGYFTGASADGRNAQSPMANANSPSGGADKKGVTAMLNSLVKLPANIHAGAVQNMKFSKKLINSKITEPLLETYFKKGGTQAMITVLDKKDLENAMREPEKHGHIMVRVGGFSARFVNLSKPVQEEILSRTLYE